MKNNKKEEETKKKKMKNPVISCEVFFTSGMNLGALLY